MARRALRKIVPAVDVSTHLLELASMQPPLDLMACFERSAPLEIEVGSGKGLFLCRAGGARPDRNFLGIEIARKYARFIAARLIQQKRDNARVIQGDAQVLFRDYLPDGAAAAVHIYFPDPWWKKRHHKRRIMNAPFLRQVVRVLSPGGRLHFWTDVAEYYRLSLDLIRAQTILAGPLSVPEVTAEDQLDYRTHFERRTRLQRRPVYRAEFVKPEQRNEQDAASAGGNMQPDTQCGSPRRTP